MRSSLRAALAILCVVGHAASAQSDTAAVRAVADSFFRATSLGQFHDAARLMDLEAFDAERKSAVEGLRHPLPRRHFTAEFFLKQEPDMPRAVAEYQARRFNRTPDETPHLRMEYGVSTPDSVAALPVEELAARRLAAGDMRTQMRETIAGTGPYRCDVTPAERREMLDSVDAMVIPPARIIGVVMDGDIAWVMHTSPTLGDTAGQPAPAAAPRAAAERGWVAFPPSLLEMRRVGGRWRVGPTSFGSQGFAIGGGCRRTRPKAGAGKGTRKG